MTMSQLVTAYQAGASVSELSECQQIHTGTVGWEECLQRKGLSPVRARPIADTATARLAARRCSASSACRTGGNGSQDVVSTTRCTLVSDQQGLLGG